MAVRYHSSCVEEGSGRQSLEKGKRTDRNATVSQFLTTQCTGQGARSLTANRNSPSTTKFHKSELSWFTAGKSASHHILALRVRMQRRRKVVQGMLAACVALMKAFDSVGCSDTTGIPQDY